MRRAAILTVAWLILAAPSAVFAQSWVSAVFPEQSHDFGTVARGSKVHHSFRVVNTTNQDLHIATWRTKCGCTDVRVGARDIPPGTQTVVEATVDTSKFQGYKASGLVLVLDRPAFAEVDLNLTCFIRGDVILNPGQVDFGVVARGSKPTVTLMLNYFGGMSGWAVSKMQTQSPLVVAQLKEAGSSAGGGQVQYQLTATLDSDAPPGHFKDEITLLTNDPSSPRIPISVTATVQSAVSVSPSILNLGRVKAGATVKRVVVVRCAQPFKITGLSGKADELTASPVPEQPAARHTVTVSFKAPTQPGPYNAAVEVATDVKDEPSVKATVFATIVP